MKRIFNRRVVWTVVTLHLLAFAAMRGVVFAGLSRDEAEAVRHAQEFALAYGLKNPPLYAWLQKLTELATGGPSLSAVLVVKAATFLGAAAGTWWLAGLVLRERSAQGAATLGIFALAFWGWEALSTLTHSALIAVVAPCLLAAAIMLRREASLLNAGVFGLAMAAAFLAKWNCALLMVSVIIALLLDPQGRRVLLSRTGLVALIVMLVLVLPPGLKALTLMDQADDLMGVRFQPGTETTRPWASALALIEAAGLFLLPLGAVMLLTVPRAMGKGCLKLVRGSAGDEAGVDVAALRLLATALVTLLVLAMVGMAIFGAGQVRTHLAMPLIAAPVLLVGLACLGGRCARASLTAGVAGTAVALLAPTAGLMGKALHDGREGSAYLNADFSPLAEAVRAAEPATVLTWDYKHGLSGELRRRYDAPRYKAFDRVETDLSELEGPCLVVTPAGFPVSAAPHLARVRDGGGRFEEGRQVAVPVRFGEGRTLTMQLWRLTGYSKCA